MNLSHSSGGSDGLRISSEIFTASPGGIQKIIEILQNHQQLKRDWWFVIKEMTERRHWEALHGHYHQRDFSNWLRITLDCWIADRNLKFPDLVKCIKKYNPNAGAELEARLLYRNSTFEGDKVGEQTADDRYNDELTTKRKQLDLQSQKWWPRKKELINSFVERRIQNTLLVDELRTMILNNTNKKVVVAQKATVSGLGGVGKTTIAIGFAMKYENAYNHIIWLDCGEHQLDMHFRKLARKFNINDRDSKENLRSLYSIANEIYVALSDFKCLFIFDNADEYKIVINLLPKNNSHHTLITSRNPCWGSEDSAGRIDMIKLDVFSVKESALLIRHTLNINSENEYNISELSNKLGYFPLALRIAVSTIVKLNWNIRMYLEDLKLNVDRLVIKEYDMSLQKRLCLTIDVIARNEDYGETALFILNIFAFLSPDNIQKSLVIEIIEKSDTITDHSLALLQEYSLITLCSTEEGHTFRIHRMLQEVVRFRMNPNVRNTVLRSALTSMNKTYIHEYYYGNICSVWDYAVKHEEIVDEFWKFFLLVVAKRKNRNRRGASFRFLSEALPHLKRVEGSVHRMYLTTADAISHVYFRMGMYHDSFEWWDSLYDILTHLSLLPNSGMNEETKKKYLAAAVLNKGIVMERLGCLDGAVEAYKQVADLNDMNRYQDAIEIVYGAAIEETEIIVNPIDFDGMCPRVVELKCKIVTLHLQLGDVKRAWHECSKYFVSIGENNYDLWKHNENFIIVSGLKLLKSSVNSANGNIRSLQVFQYLWKGLKLSENDVSSVVQPMYWTELVKFSSTVSGSFNKRRFEFAAALFDSGKLEQAGLIWSDIENIFSVHFNATVLKERLGKIEEAIQTLTLLRSFDIRTGLNVVQSSTGIKPLIKYFKLSLYPIEFDEFVSQTQIRCLIVYLLLKAGDVNRAIHEFQDLNSNSRTWWLGIEEIAIVVTVQLLIHLENVESQRDRIVKFALILLDSLKVVHSKDEHIFSETIRSIKIFMGRGNHIPMEFWTFLEGAIQEKHDVLYENQLIQYLRDFVIHFNRILGPHHVLSWRTTNVIANTMFRQEEYIQYCKAWQEVVSTLSSIANTPTTQDESSEEILKIRKYTSIARFNLAVGMERLGQFREATELLNEIDYDNSATNSRSNLIRFDVEDLNCSVVLQPMQLWDKLPSKFLIQLTVLVYVMRLDNVSKRWKQWEQIKITFGQTNYDWWKGYESVIAVNGLNLLRHSSRLIKGWGECLLSSTVEFIQYLCEGFDLHVFNRRLFYYRQLLLVSDDIALDIIKHERGLQRIYTALYTPVCRYLKSSTNIDQLELFGLRILRHFKSLTPKKDIQEITNRIKEVRIRLGFVTHQVDILDQNYHLTGMSEVGMRTFEKFDAKLNTSLVTNIYLKFVKFEKLHLVKALNKFSRLKSLVLEQVGITATCKERAYLPLLTVFIIDLTDNGFRFDPNKLENGLLDISLFYKVLENKDWAINTVNSLQLNEFKISHNGWTRSEINRLQYKLELDLGPEHNVDEILKSVDFQVETIVLKRCELSYESLTHSHLNPSVLHSLKHLTLISVVFTVANENGIALDDSLLQHFPLLEELHIDGYKGTPISMKINSLPANLIALELKHITMVLFESNELHTQHGSLLHLNLHSVTFAAAEETPFELCNTLLKHFPQLKTLDINYYGDPRRSLKIQNLPQRLTTVILHRVTITTDSINEIVLNQQFELVKHLTLHFVDFIGKDEGRLELHDLLLKHFPYLEVLDIRTTERSPVTLNLNCLPKSLKKLKLFSIKLIYHNTCGEVSQRNFGGNQTLSQQKQQLESISLWDVYLHNKYLVIRQEYGDTCRNVFIDGLSKGTRATTLVLQNLIEINSINLICICNFDWESAGKTECNSAFVYWLEQVGVATDSNIFCLERQCNMIGREQTENKSLWTGRALSLGEFYSMRNNIFKFTKK